MIKYFSLSLILCLSISIANAQVLLDADGPGNTYDLITSVLAPGYNPIEVPDCGHGTFGEHIDEIFDNDLNDYVFRFHIHTDEDDDRCINFDRQRNEIKTYDQSPDNLLGVEGETFEYKWKFKIDEDFQSSPKFTHLHQLKAVGGPESSTPLITLSTRDNGTVEDFRLRYAEHTSPQVTLMETDLAPFKGVWLEVLETVVYGENGSYTVEIIRVSDGLSLFDYTNNSIRMWRDDADFVRPKWGIYRSLDFPEYLRDEEVLFADFCIEEVNVILAIELNSFEARLVGDNVRLDWQTLAEPNNLEFEIQKSKDGINWNFLESVNGSGNSNSTTNYEAVDENVQVGKSYYRLKYRAVEGDFSFSTIASIEQKSSIDIQIFPNPTNDFVEFKGLKQGHLIEVFDLKGRNILQTVAEDNKLNLSALAKGIFIIKITNGEEIVVKRIVR